MGFCNRVNCYGGVWVIWEMKAYKVRLEPNNKQRTFFKKCAGASRYVYNWGLRMWQTQYEAYKEDNTLTKPSQYGLCVQFNAVKDIECPWIRELPYAIVEGAFQRVGAAYKNFFRRLKQKSDKFGYPKFKNKYSRKTFQLRGVKVYSDYVYIPRLGNIRLSQSDYIPIDGHYGIYATISERAGHWYISVLVKDASDLECELNHEILGIDLGIKSLAVISNGKVFDNPKPLRESEVKLKRLQRELSRRKATRGSNYSKTKLQLAKAHARIADIRSFTLHQISDYVTHKCKPEVIVLEDLNVSGMLKNHKLAKAISDVGFYELRRQIEYKSKAMGIEVVFADQFFSSSKTCSRCGYHKADLTLQDRVFECPECNLIIDRDFNAALNLRNYVNML